MSVIIGPTGHVVEKQVMIGQWAGLCIMSDKALMDWFLVNLF